MVGDTDGVRVSEGDALWERVAVGVGLGVGEQTIFWAQTCKAPYDSVMA